MRKRKNESIPGQPPKKSPQQGFPLLQLPLLAQIEVLKHMKSTELMLFSLASKRAKLAAEASKRKMGALTWTFEGNADTLGSAVQLGIEAAVFLNCTGAPFKELLEESHPETVSLNGLHFSVAFYQGIWYVLAGSPRDVMDVTEVLTKHLLDVFRGVHDFKFCGHNLTIDPKDIFIRKYTKTFANVQFVGTISGNFMKFVLENFTTKRFWVFSKPDGNIQYSGPLKMQILMVRNTEWLTPDALLNMKCKRVNISHCTADIDMNRLLKHWQSGKGLRSLEYIEINKLSNPDCLEGIETFPANTDKWPRRERWRPAKDAYKDIQRIDGKLASVISGRDGHFHFFRHRPS